MKNLPTPMKIALLPAISVIFIFALHAFAAKPPTAKLDAPFVLNFKKAVHVAVDKEKFETALKTHTKDKKTYHATYDGQVLDPSDMVQMKTTKVTSGIVTPAPSASAAGGVNVTQAAGFNSLEDLKNFLAAIGTP